MKNRLIMLIATLGFAFTTGFSQKSHGQLDVNGKIEDRLKKMDEVVKFTGTQREEMKKLFTNLVKRRKDIICANELGSESLKAEMKKLKEEAKEEVKKILTSNQVKLWQDHKKSIHDQRKKEGGGKNGTDTREK